ncbi:MULTISPECIES: hypothetical protein [unclassified Streptomyces]|uniref:hypothetical protein n=1 Tax=unclassified Streptomyces TaxID=2593676 RepID=UPI003668E734
MNVHRVHAAAGVLHASMQQGRTLPETLAYALESAQLLNSPESAAELLRLRKRVAALEAESVGLRETIAAAIEHRGQALLPTHPVWSYIPAFAAIARGLDVAPRPRPDGPRPPGPERAASLAELRSLLAAQRESSREAPAVEQEGP